MAQPFLNYRHLLFAHKKIYLLPIVYTRLTLYRTTCSVDADPKPRDNKTMSQPCKYILGPINQSFRAVARENLISYNLIIFS